MIMQREINAPRTSSVGRLFDAAAALILAVRYISYDGEAAIRLEAAAHPNDVDAMPMPSTIDADGIHRGDWRPLIDAIVHAIAAGVSVENMAARFHNTLAHWAAQIAATVPMSDVVLGGGCFQNARLTTRTRAAIVELGKTAYVPSKIPPGDGGLAVGQLAIGMAQWLRSSSQPS